VQTESLQQLAQASEKGMYFFASGDKKSIDEAFGKAIQVIQGQLIVED
jgi:hypothetical protein